MSRTVPEWQGASDDADIPARVKLRIWERCGGRCGLTGRKIMPGDARDYDHITPLWLGGRHAESNLHVVLKDAHKEKTKAEATVRAKINRVRAKHLGIYPPSRAKIQSRGFDKSRNHKVSNGALSRRERLVRDV
ncbi:MAG: HNH endonuclease signature motif containing protein [Hyphomonadaceae bacterium]|nr:HNH endonuclease signature motif containing protein [Hyphomonadaceae bacterium]